MLASDLPPWFIRTLAFLFGSLWGSFFNVAIYRWPREMSVVHPPSHCPSCGSPVRAWHNVPIFGYLFLRGRAACCGAKLTPRYMFVELMGAVMCLALAERTIVRADPLADMNGLALTTLLDFAFVGGLLIATFVDLEWMEIPDEVSIGGTALGLATVGLRVGPPSVAEAALGAGGAFLLVQLLLVWSWERLTGRRGMGEGDSKLLMFIGAFVGWQGALFALVAGAFQGILGTVLATMTGTPIGPQLPEAEAEDATSGGDGDDAELAREDDAAEDDAAEDDAAEDDAAEDDAAEDGAAEAADAPDEDAPSLTTVDGVTATLHGAGGRLSIADRHGRLLWEWVTELEAAAASRAIPFGPFLAIGAIEYLFFGPQLIDAYLSLFLD